MKSVVIFQHRLLHYRVGFFEKLRAACLESGIHLSLIHGQPTSFERTKSDTGQLSWSTEVKNRSLRILGRDIVVQPIPRLAREADLVVLMQENRLLSNYFFLLRKASVGRKVAFWGHGANFQSRSPNGVLERWKRHWICSVDWWFSYTEASTKRILDAGFPPAQVSTLNNAIDNAAFRRDLDSVGAQDIDLLRSKLGIDASADVGLICGSLYAEKRVDFLLAACDEIRAVRPNFHLIVVGEGPDARLVREASQTRAWIHAMGALRGREKAVCFKVSNIVLNPGLVGLHILDSFCAGVPMVTAHSEFHSPEVSYLKDGENGIMTPYSIQLYVDAVCDLLSDRVKLSRLSDGACRSAGEYTLDRMVSSFMCGIHSCLEGDMLDHGLARKLSRQVDS